MKTNIFIKQPIITIRIPMNGNNFFKISIVLFVLQIVFSCGSIKQDLIKHNYFNGDYFYNDSLKIGIDFWGALDFTNLQKIKYTVEKILPTR